MAQKRPLQNGYSSAQEKLNDRQRAYKDVFDLQSPVVVKVLEDLSTFCRARESTFHPDPRIHALLEGRREVFLRIKEHIELGLEELLVKYNNERKDK